ncbi:hypothetical protein BSNK01_13670 [Bacillaceae bacterium]
MVEYAIIFVCATGVMVTIKMIVLPYVIWQIFPLSDLGATIYEICIMSFGGLTACLYLYLGYLAKRKYALSLLSHIGSYLLVQFPFVSYALLKQAAVQPERIVSFFRWAEEWVGLLAEPARLLFMVYPWTDFFALLFGLCLTVAGRRVELAAEGEHKAAKGGASS